MFITSGYGNFTVDQFSLINEILASGKKLCSNPDEDTSRMPSYNTTKDTVWEDVQAHSFPKVTTVHIGDPVKSRPRIRTASFFTTASGHEKDPRDCARVIDPSEWARIDVQSKCFFQEVYQNSGGRQEDTYSIENAPITRERDVVLLRTLRLWVDRNGLITQAVPDEQVTFHCQKFPETPDKQTWSAEGWRFLSITPHNDRGCVVLGSVGPLWVVASRTSEPNPEEKPTGLSGIEAHLWTALCTANVSAARRGPQKGNIEVGVIPDQSDDSEDDNWNYNFAAQETVPRERQKQQLMTFYIPSAENMDVLPGDVCTIVRPTGGDIYGIHPICI